MCDTSSGSIPKELAKLCVICDNPVLSEKVTPGAAAIETIIECSKKRGDGKHIKLLCENSQVVVHRSCRNNYTKSFYVQQAKRLSLQKENEAVSPKRLRSTCSFDFDGVCLFCSKKLGVLEKKSNDKVRRVISKEFQQKIEEQALARKEKWGREIYGRICSVDLTAVKAVYHYSCWKNFRTRETKQGPSLPGRPSSDEVSRAMEIIYKYMEASDDCQFSLNELLELVKDYSISLPTLKNKLIEHYKEEVVITSTKNRIPVVCFKNVCDQVLSDIWYQQRKTNEQEEELRIISMAAEIIRKHIEETVYDTNSYPNSIDFLKGVDKDIPKPLAVFIDKLTSKKTQTKKSDLLVKKCTAISHCLISIIKPRSFISPLLLGISSYIYHRIGSKSLINVLSNLGLCATYHSMKVFESSLIMAGDLIIEPGASLQFVFDNCDFNVDTIDGHGTFHNLSGIKCVTPAALVNTPSDKILKQTRLQHSALIEKKGMVEVIPFCSKHSSGINELKFTNLEQVYCANTFDEYPSCHDVTWMAGKFKNIEGTPGWHGFLEKLTSSEYSEITKVVQLPFIMAPPSDHSTIYTALSMAVTEGEKLGLHNVFVTFDLPLFMKAVDVVFSVPPESPLKKVIPRLGGFHLIMSFLGTIGFLMADSGLLECLSVIYAENSVKNILSGHAYARAVRAHSLVTTVLSKMIFRNVIITEEEAVTVNKFLEDMESCPPNQHTISEHPHIKSLNTKFRLQLDTFEQNGPTAKLWVQYFKMSTLVKKYIEAERTGNWELHLYIVKLMMPYFISSGHFHYLKASNIYLQLMSELPTKMDPLEYATFLKTFCVRRTNKFYSGTWTDMVIEQTANRDFKVAGGVVRRGFTDDILNAYVVTKPALSEIIETIEEFSGTKFFSSEQHVDLRESRIKRDNDDVDKLSAWFDLHDPFSTETTVVVSLSTGVSGTDQINCHLAKEIGEERMKALEGKSFLDIKMKRSDNVRPLSAVNSTIKVYDKTIHIDPLILYQRMLMKNPPIDDLSSYFKYEIAPYPLSLFNNSGMRKSVKSSLYEEFKCVNENLLEGVETFIIDGGYLLHVVKWNKLTCSSYSDVCDLYVRYVQKHFKSAVIVFDGYDDQDSIKGCEHLRRYKHFAPHFSITEITPVCGNQELFLANPENKKQLINMLTTTLQKYNFEVIQAYGDADTVIVNTAIEKAHEIQPAIVSQDSDILVLMTALVPFNKVVYLLKPKIGRTNQRLFSSTSLQQQYSNINNYVLLGHSFSGCDSTSAIYGKGKKQILKILESEAAMEKVISTFNSKGSTQIEVKEAGETLFLSLYGEKNGKFSLDEWRYRLFQKSLKRSSAKLESLPPSSDSAAQHSYRCYYQVQLWLGNKLVPEQWGWTRQDGKLLLPTKMKLDVAPEDILKLVSCACKGTCSTKQCSCKKSGITCTHLCKVCEGVTCLNAEVEEKEPTLFDQKDLSEGNPFCEEDS